jgi:exoribonuclease-2
MSSPRRFLQEVAREAMRERGFEPDFSQAAQAQVAELEKKASSANALAPSAVEGPSQNTRDLRHLIWCSIDNDDSRDLDQLSVAQTTPGGDTKILVGIADVDSLVHRDTPVD